MTQFSGTVKKIVYRNEENGWTVATVRLQGGGEESIVGTLPGLGSGEDVKIEGEWTEHQKFGRQIRVSRCEVTRPETVEGIQEYLISTVRGIGEVVAKQITDKFGLRTWEILESQPERLLEISGIGKSKLKMIAESYADKMANRQTMMFLQKYGFPAAISNRIWEAYHEMTEKVVRSNPYRLVDEIDGVGFRTVDKLAFSLGVSPEKRERLESGVRYVLNEAVNGSGHVYLPETVLIQQAVGLLGASEEIVQTVVKRLILNGELIAEDFESPRAIYLRKMYNAECDTARLLLQRIQTEIPAVADDEELDRKIMRYERDENVQLCAEQRKAVHAAATNGVVIITGGPGTGKTTSINCIIHILCKSGEIALCAPTGRAAKRMTEATGQTARTLHRLLECAGRGNLFGRDEDNPLDANTVIVDETSMVDIFLMRSLLRALRPGSRLILVGDADQLPSVGAGNVLRDLIQSQTIPVVRLTEVFRQAQKSMIVVNAHKINRGEAPILRSGDTDFFIERKKTYAECAQSVVSMVRDRLPKYLNTDCLRGIQVMSPMKKGELGVIALNQALQNALNPPNPRKPEVKYGSSTVFRLGDKVMQIKNDYLLEWMQDGINGKGVFNGDIGYIAEILPDEKNQILKIEFDDGRMAYYDHTMLDELEIAYCMSVHKSQGSEFEAVVLPLMNGPKMLMTRNLLYTAVTRAKKLVVIVGSENCVRMMVENNWILRRYTALAPRLTGEIPLKM